MKPRFLQCLTLLAALAVATPVVCAQGILAWKLTAGESLNYTITQGTEMQVSLAGQRQNMKLNQVMTLVWNINDVTSTESSMDQIIKRVQLSSDGGITGNFQFDSQDTNPAESGVARSISDVFGKVIDQPFKVTMKNNGTIGAVQVPDAILRTLPATGVVNEQTLRQMMTQSAVTFPDTPVSTDDSWESNQKVDVQFGTMNIGSKLTYRGRDPETGHAVIEVLPSLSITANEESPQTISLTSSEGTGRILFDTERGRVVRSDLDLTMKMKVSQFDQTVRQRTRMELLE